jgi:diketogulonate reductase-like aldo/keto reductase
LRCDERTTAGTNRLTRYASELKFSMMTDMTRREFVKEVATIGVVASAVQPQSAPMLRRAIPRSSDQIPAVGLGTWQTFDPPSASNDALARLESTLRVFHQAGGRVVDSSPMYGKSEDLVGRLSTRAGLNADLFIATKVWTNGRDAGVRQMETSMRLLGRERIDLMQIHNLVDWRTHIATLRDWKAKGRIRYIGITHYTPSAYADLERVMRSEKPDFVQLAYSIGVRDAADRLLPLAADLGIAVLVNRPFEGGDLFSRARAKPLPAFVQPFAGSWAQAFLKFILAHPAVTCAIPGTGNPEHMRDNVQAGSGRLPTPDECRELVRFLSV